MSSSHEKSAPDCYLERLHLALEEVPDAGEGYDISAGIVSLRYLLAERLKEHAVHFRPEAYEEAGLSRDRLFFARPSCVARYTEAKKANGAAQYLWDSIFCSEGYSHCSANWIAIAEAAAGKRVADPEFALDAEDIAAGLHLLLKAGLIMVDEQGKVVPTDKSRKIQIVD